MSTTLAALANQKTANHKQPTISEAAQSVIERTDLLLRFSSSEDVRSSARNLKTQVERLMDFATTATERGTRPGYVLADLHQFFVLAKKAYDRMILACRDSDATEWRAVIARRNIEDSFQKLRELVLPM